MLLSYLYRQHFDWKWHYLATFVVRWPHPIFFGTSTGKNGIEPDILINGTGNSNNIFGFHWHLGWTPLTLKSMRKIQVSNHRVFVFQFLVLFFALSSLPPQLMDSHCVYFTTALIYILLKSRFFVCQFLISCAKTTKSKYTNCCCRTLEVFQLW